MEKEYAIINGRDLMSNKSMYQTGRMQFITEDQYRAILKASMKVSLRDFFLFYLCGNLGLRVSQVIGIRIDDLQDNRLRIPIVKTDMARWIELPEAVLKRLNQYRINYSINSGYLFPGRFESTHISKSRAQRIFNYYSRKTLNINASIHSLRHFRGISVYLIRRSIHDVAETLGHKSLESSRIYARLTLGQKKDILEEAGIIDEGIDSSRGEKKDGEGQPKKEDGLGMEGRDPRDLKFGWRGGSRSKKFRSKSSK